MDMKRNKLNVAKVTCAKSGNTEARYLMRKMAIFPDWHSLYPTTRNLMYSRPHSSPCRMYPKTSCQDLGRPSSSTTIANPILSSSEVERILSQRLANKKDELRKVFQILDPNHTRTVTKGELKRTITAFLLPLTKEQFQDLLAQIPLTSSGNVLYLEFLSRFGGLDLNINVIKKGSGSEVDYNRTFKELETQLAEKIFQNMKTMKRAFQLVDVNSTGTVQPQELRRILETLCLKMRDEEYETLLKQYSIDGTTRVDYNTFLKNFSIMNDSNFKNLLSNSEPARENQQAKNTKREQPLNAVPFEDVWKNYSLDDLEKAFCQELSKSYEKIEKALSAGDPSKGGYVSLNYLKVVLDTFVYRLPRKIFIQLMKRFGVKTTTKVNWKQFLTAFYERQGFEVSKTIPLKKRSSTDFRNWSRKENIIKKLFKFSEDRYTALKKTLLFISSTPNGHVTWEELRHILNCMVAKLNDSEFTELKQTFDPEGTGVVKVSSLMDLLDDSPKVRKMFPSTDTKTSLPMAWDSVEDVVYDAITRNLQGFYDALQSYDLGETGTITKNNFKKVLHMFCPYLTNEHLLKLSTKFQDTASGRILYRRFLSSLCPSVPLPTSQPFLPKDQPSAQFQNEEQDQPDLLGRTQPVKDMTKEEVIDRLKHCIQQQDPVFRKQFLYISKEPDAKIGLEDFRKVLEESGMPMNDNQYAMLASKIGFKKGGMSYQDFTTGFEDTQVSGLETVPLQSPRPTTKMNLDDYFMSAEECLQLFPKRVKESFRDPYAAFFRIDMDRDGIISMHDFHRLLQYLLLNMKDDEFERFLGLLGLRLSVTLNFREFQNLCEKRPWRSDEAPQRLIKYKQKVADSDLACEQAHQYLVTKAKNRWADLSKNFIETDNEGHGILRRRDIKNALYGFDIPLTPREFEKLWQNYDTGGRGYITYQEFLQRLGIRYSPKVHRPYKEDYFNFLGHFTKPKQIEEEIQELQQMTERETLMDHYEEISKALDMLEKSKSGSTALFKVQKVLQECGCPMKEEELISLLKSLNISVHNNCINTIDFLRALEINRASKAQPKEKEEGMPITFSRLNPQEVVKSMQAVVDSSQPALLKAFSALDKEDTGFVKAMEFGDVLKSFCQKLTDNQYNYFLRKLRIHLAPYIHWKYFLENFSSFLDETADEWAENMPKAPPPTSPKEMATRDILARVHKAVTSHYHTIAQELENFDTIKSNTVSRDEFRSICTRHIQILTDEQFDRLWSEMPVNAKGKLKYQDFLSMFNTERAPSSPMAAGDSGDSTVAQKGSGTPEVTQGTRSTLSSPRDLRSGMKSRSQPCTPLGTPPLQNCEPIENKLRKQMQGCWRELLKECKEKDTDKQGSITTAEFLALVEKFKLDISKEESQQLIIKYDLKNNGKFAYCDFIQSCVLLLKAKETSLMRRMRIQNADKLKEAGMETTSFYSALLRIQPKIVHCWRPMRRTFKAYDQNGTGLLSVADFRKVLRQYSINLSEEEFFHVLEYYDKSLSSKISYNDFLRAFLQ